MSRMRMTLLILCDGWNDRCTTRHDLIRYHTLDTRKDAASGLILSIPSLSSCCYCPVPFVALELSQRDAFKVLLPSPARE